MDKLVMEIGERIRGMRLRKGWTSEALAAYCDVDRATMSRLERGDSNPTIQTLYKVAKGLNVPLADIVDVHTFYYEEHTDERLMDEYMKYMGKLTRDEQNDILELMRTFVKWKGKCNTQSSGD